MDKRTYADRRKENIEGVKRFRKNRKLKCIEYKGGKCEKCGYSKSTASLVFHHLDPSQKEFSLGHRGLTRSWEKTKIELDKCALLCANCHGEVHEELDNPSLRQS